MTDTREDRKLIADVLELDRGATDGPWWADVSQPRCWVESAKGPICDVNTFTPPIPNVNEDLIAAYRTAAPDLARRLAALLDALEDQYYVGTQDVDERPSDVIGRIRDAYARNLGRGSARATLPKCCVDGCPNTADPRWFYQGEPACDGHGEADPHPWSKP